ncbi:MAG: M17 family peptidase N-terminal domain-containing protein, partial [Acidimicrobiia bacterium]|nr:M17 family peptidase N-terminal domain-containing protein [Acidimicrobiia bacterium]
MEITPTSDLPDLEGATVIAGVMEAGVAAPGSEQFVAGLDRRTLEVNDFEGKEGQSITVAHDEAYAVVLVGLGSEVAFESLRDASASAIRKVKTERAVSLLCLTGLDGATRAVTEGSLLGSYQYRDYKTERSEERVTRCSEVELVGAEEDAVLEARALADATMRARDWVNTPAKDQSPDAYAAEIAEYASEASVDAEVWDKERIVSEGLGAVLGVAAGSRRDPRVVVLRHVPSEPVTHLALVGKGITFDTGGLSLKSTAFMDGMKADMAGSAAAVAATVAIARLGIPVEV